MSWYAPVAFRYTSYRPDPTPTHVYCIVYGKNGEEIIIDPVWYDFDLEKEYRKKYDHKMKISTLAGTDEMNGNEVPQIPVDRYTFHNIKHWNDILNTAGKNTPLYKEAQKRLKYYLTNSGIKAELTGGVHGIGKHGHGKEKLRSLFKKVVHGGKAFYLQLPRIDFLALVSLNYRNFANRIANGNQDAIKKLWVDRLGGNWNSLQRAVARGKKKKPLFGKPKHKINGVEVEQPVGSLIAISAMIASATPIILLIAKLIPKSTGGEEGGGDGTGGDGSDTSFDEKDHNPDSADSGEKESGVVKIISKIGGIAKTVGEIFTPKEQADGGHEITDDGHPAKEAGFGLLPILLIAGIGATFLFKKKGS